MSDNHSQVPPIGTLKTQAKRLRTELANDGISVSHSKSLEMLAHQFGYKDWNGLYAAAQTNSILSTLRIGQTVNGIYLGQKIVGEIIGMQKLSNGTRYKLTLDLDEPVDVVSFGSFSNMRKRITCRVDSGGVSSERTSNGQPHMVLGGTI
ncbi:MAG: hypothetical protein JKY25_07825 [Robiginitomaculum sp.]|nr:hypothetical protein [Robiginitomaculum sp.]